MGYFPPLAVFDSDTVSTAMAALLVYDVKNPLSPANPSVALSHPHEILSSNAFHGGAQTTLPLTLCSARSAICLQHKLLTFAGTFRLGVKPSSLASLQVVGGKLFGRATAPVASNL